MTIGENIKKIRKDKGLQQKAIAVEVGLDQSNYNKIENSKREPSLEILQKLSTIFNLSVDEIINPSDSIPTAVTIEDKTMTEKIRMIDQLDDVDKHVVFSMIDTMLTKKKFQDFFQQNIAR